MLVLGLILQALVFGLLEGMPQPECCETKTVGPKDYKLVKEMDTSSYGCPKNCVYEEVGNAGPMFCFKPGNLPVTCGNTTSPPGGGSSTASPTNSSSSSCQCGKKRTVRIVGGTETEINEYPWMAVVAIKPSEKEWCGGTVIGSRWILSASHCMFLSNTAVTAEELVIVLGEHDNSITTESIIPRKVFDVEKYINHPEYDNPSQFANDITLIRIKGKIDLNVYTPACIPNTGDDFVGKDAWVYGWGAEFSGASTYPEKLLEVQVPVVALDVCKAAMAKTPDNPPVIAGMLCAGGVKDKDGCQGDSGGPLTTDVDGKHFLIGDVSWGDGCGLEGKYGVYGDVAFYRSWIDSTIKANEGSEFCTA